MRMAYGVRRARMKKRSNTIWVSEGLNLEVVGLSFALVILAKLCRMTCSFCLIAQWHLTGAKDLYLPQKLLHTQLGSTRGREGDGEGVGTAKVVAIPTSPIGDMKPGTSGLRKKVSVWQEGNYLNNFIQSALDVVVEDPKSSTIVLGGDGRYFNAQAIQIIIQMAAAHGVKRIFVGKDGLLSTPAASAVIRERDGGAACMGIILTASHNPGGVDGDFGIKFNNAVGSPVTDAVTERIFSRTQTINEFFIVEGSQPLKLSCVGHKETMAGTCTIVDVIDPVEDYLGVLQGSFDFEGKKGGFLLLFSVQMYTLFITQPTAAVLSQFIARPGGFRMAFDGMAGVSGPYAHRILTEELRVPEGSLLRCEPCEDFGGGHPDPNLKHNAELMRKMGIVEEDRSPTAATTPLDFGAAVDGDGDRNMILGRNFFVTPSDSVAILAANANAVPWFSKRGGLKCAARSMPSSSAIDHVAKYLGIPLFETPTGWKFFGNLMDADKLGHSTSYCPIICGEESFGTGSDHIREKDGLWAVLAWLSVLVSFNPNPHKPLVGVQDIVEAHWTRYGRNYYIRFDYVALDADAATSIMAEMRGEKAVTAAIGRVFDGGLVVSGLDDFNYTDPVDGSVSSNEGIRLMFGDGSRVVFRLSGTGSVGKTLRMYVEKFEPDAKKQKQPVLNILKDVADAGICFSRLKEFTGREHPDVIT